MTDKPSSNEDEYFAKQEYAKLQDMAKATAAAMAGDAQAELMKLHYMRCPKCGQELATIGLHGVEVDKCGQCDGMWLDAGELEQVLGNEGGSPLKSLLDIFKG